MPRAMRTITTQGVMPTTGGSTAGTRKRTRHRTRRKVVVGGQQFAAVARNIRGNTGDVALRITSGLHDLGFLKPGSNQQQVYAAINLCLGAI